MEDRVAFYKKVFPMLTEELLAEMIADYDKAQEERVLFCQKLPARVAKRKAEYEKKMNPQTKRK